ncbi:hypothetical protein NSS66_14210 [Paenibacillus sp. FSL R10-2748]
MEYTQGFEAHLRSKDRSENTVSCYIRDVLQFITWYQRKTEYGLDKWIELDGVEYKKYLQSTIKLYSPLTVRSPVSTYFPGGCTNKDILRKKYISKQLGIRSFGNTKG